jgi:nucleoside permease NupC
MFKNCVFKMSVSTQKWIKAAGVRAIKTMAQAAIAGIGAAAAMGQVDWKYVMSASVLAGVLSILMSITGIPEVEADTEAENN